jgi:succinoglycan biosynthesis protein ExoV
MKIYYHQAASGNFGDDLNLLMWSRFLPGLLTGTVANSSSEQLEAVTEHDQLLVGIGTLLNHRIPRRGQKIVLGAGAGYGNLPDLDERWDFRFVRGPRTAQTLGLPREKAITDPAVLVRLLDWKVPDARHACALMLHHSNMQNSLWQEVAQDLQIKLIDPRKDPAEVIPEIAASDLLITESLHGAIIADTFRVPWVPISSDYAVLKSKWHDWCDTVGVIYRPTRIPMIWGNESPVKRLIKFHLARRVVRKLMTASPVLLSGDGIVESLTERIVAEVHAVRSQYTPATS